MKTLKVLLQEVVSGLKAWATSTFAQDSNTVHRTGDETVGGGKTWTDTNIFSITLKQVNSAITKGTNPQSDIGAFNVYWGGTGVSSLTNALFTQRGYVYADGSTSYILYALENVLGGTHTSLSLKYDPNDTIKRYALMRGDFRPYYDNSYNLGIPTLKWKTINGINPGALSLPSESPSRTNLDPTNWNTTGTAVNEFTPPTDGWLGVQVQSADTTNLTGQYVFAGRSTGGDTFWPSAQLSNLVGDFESGKLIGCVMIPVIAGKKYHVRIKMGKTLEQGSKIYASFYPCLGNV